MGSIQDLLDNYRGYPLEVTIETTGKCNANCVFCPHSELERKNEYMGDDLFLRIIGHLKKIPPSHYFYISPFKVNEFLMDRQIFERIHIINEALPNALIRIFTNLNVATEADIQRICQIKNLYDLDISLNSLDKEEYRGLMGIDLEKTLKNVRRLITCIRENGIVMQKPKILFSRVAQTAETDKKYMETFAQMFSDHLDILEPIVISRQEWIDFIPSEAPLNQDRPCSRWADVNICCNGIVSFCCMDGRAAFPWGDVKEKTVLEIYNQPKYRKLREECPNKSEVTPCRYCSQ